MNSLNAQQDKGKRWKVTINGKDVTDFVESVSWSGNLQQASRTLNIKLVRGCRPDVGDKASFFYEERRLFVGTVMYVDIDPWNNNAECSDKGIFLANNYTFKEYKGTPQSIAKKVCAEFGVPIGKLAQKTNTKKVTSTGNLSAFKVIEEAYEGKGKNARQYLYVFQDGKLYIEKAGSEIVANLEEELVSAKRTRSIKGMVNKVVILNDKNKQSGYVENKGDRAKYGTFQKTYKKEKKKNASTEAKESLAGLERTGSVTCLGNPKCIAGKAVNVTEKMTGLSGKQIIKSDKHTFTSASYEMSLEFFYYSE